MANRGIRTYGEVGDPVLSCYTSRSGTVLAWCIDLPPDNNMEEGDDGSPVDSEFSVNFWYTNHKDGASKSSMFKVNREEIRANLHMFGSYERWGTVVVLDWLKELGVSRDEAVYLVALGLVIDGFESLLHEVDTRGRKSLDMFVDIEVLAVDDEDEYQFEEGFGFVEEEEDEEVKKANMEVAKVVLSTSGVKFVKVGSSMSYEVVGFCAICLEDFEDDIKKSSDGDHTEEDEVVVVLAILPCSHMLHQDCLLPWVAKGNWTCPLCRDDMLSVPHFEGEAGTV